MRCTARVSCDTSRRQHYSTYRGVRLTPPTLYIHPLYIMH